jgi:hypothetical protein
LVNNKINDAKSATFCIITKISGFKIGHHRERVVGSLSFLVILLLKQVGQVQLRAVNHKANLGKKICPSK